MNIMNILKTTVLGLTLLGTALELNAQNLEDKPRYMNMGGYTTDGWKKSLVPDGVYDKVAHINMPLAWQPVREADIMFKKRVWREIDTRLKQNVAFRYPGDDETGGGYFIEVILDAIKKGKIKAYSAFSDDRFTQELTVDQVNEMIVGKDDTLWVEDPITGETTMSITHRDFNPEVVTKFRLKEDVIFDRNLGRMVTRIVGLSPLKDNYSDDGTFRGSSPMFWIYYPEARDVFAQYEVYNAHNEVARMTWDEYFEGRFFSSYVIKVSNPLDLRIKDLGLNDMEALHAGKEEELKLFNKEHDMWVY